METITSVDPLYPLLTKDHFRALDRRLAIVLGTVQYCIDDNQHRYRKLRPTQRSHLVLH